MDPGSLNIADWLMRLNALRILWLCLLMAPAAAVSLLTAHAIIPSLVDSHAISRNWSLIRFPLYLFGLGTEINYKKALDLNTLAAEQGYAEAQYNLAIMYVEGFAPRNLRT